MSLARKYKLYRLGIVPDNTTFEIIKHLEKFFSDLEVVNTRKYEPAVFYFKNGECIMIYNIFCKEIYLNISKFRYTILHSYVYSFGLYDELLEVIEEILKNELNIEIYFIEPNKEFGKYKYKYQRIYESYKKIQTL